MARLNECILYRNFEHGEILDKMAELMNASGQDYTATVESYL